MVAPINMVCVSKSRAKLQHFSQLEHYISKKFITFLCNIHNKLYKVCKKDHKKADFIGKSPNRVTRAISYA